jgi:hypothetical protein
MEQIRKIYISAPDVPTQVKYKLGENNKNVEVRKKMVGEYPLLRTKGALRAAGAAAVGGLGNAWAAARRGRRPRRACAFQ